MSATYDHLDEFERQFEAQQHRYIEALGQDFVQNAKEFSPVRTGHMRDSNAFEWDGEDGVAYNDASYSAHNNFGFTARNGRRVPGSHFFERAGDQTMQDAESIAGEVFV